jgi:hypothetical protein
MARDLDIQCERAISGNLTHPGFFWAEGVTPDGGDGWDGFFCPRCHASESARPELCVRPFSSDIAMTRLLEDVIEQRGMHDAYVRALLDIVIPEGTSVLSFWRLIRATPEQRARAFLRALAEESHNA